MHLFKWLVLSSLLVRGSAAATLGTVVGLEIVASLSGAYLLIYLILGCYATVKVMNTDHEKKMKPLRFVRYSIKEFRRNKSTYFAVLFHVLDQATDIQASYEYYHAWQHKSDEDNTQSHRWLFWTSVGILTSHRLISTLGVWLASHNLVNTCLQILDLALVRAVVDGHIRGRTEPGTVQRFLQTMEACFESFPQLVLSLVYLLRTQQLNLAIIVQSLFSVYTLSNRVCADDSETMPEEWKTSGFGCRMKEAYGCRFPLIRFPWFSRVFLFRLPEIFQRVAVLSLFWAVIGGLWLIPVLIADFVLCKCISLCCDSDLNRDPFSTEFYHYFLYFKPGMDSVFTWLVVRPLLHSVYLVIIYQYSHSMDHNSDHRNSVLRSGLGMGLFAIASLASFMPALFLMIWEPRCIDDCFEQSTEVETGSSLARLVLASSAVSRDLQRVMQTRDYDRLNELLGFGADINLVLKSMTLSDAVLALLEGCESFTDLCITRSNQGQCGCLCSSDSSSSHHNRGRGRRKGASMLVDITDYQTSKEHWNQWKSAQRRGLIATLARGVRAQRLPDSVLAPNISDVNDCIMAVLFGDAADKGDFPLNHRHLEGGRCDFILDALLMSVDRMRDLFALDDSGGLCNPSLPLLVDWAGYPRWRFSLSLDSNLDSEQRVRQYAEMIRYCTVNSERIWQRKQRKNEDGCQIRKQLLNAVAVLSLEIRNDINQQMIGEHSVNVTSPAIWMDGFVLSTDLSMRHFDRIFAVSSDLVQSTLSCFPRSSRLIRTSDGTLHLQFRRERFLIPPDFDSGSHIHESRKRGTRISRRKMRDSECELTVMRSHQTQRSVFLS